MTSDVKTMKNIASLIEKTVITMEREFTRISFENKDIITMKTRVYTHLTSHFLHKLFLGFVI